MTRKKSDSCKYSSGKGSCKSKTRTSRRETPSYDALAREYIRQTHEIERLQGELAEARKACKIGKKARR